MQIHEAHSSAWPTGLVQQPEPQTCLMDRLRRANEFIAVDQPPFPVLVDTWADEFEKTFQAWPDKYYLIDRDMIVIAKSTYGTRADALIDVDCINLVRGIIANN